MAPRILGKQSRRRPEGLQRLAAAALPAFAGAIEIIDPVAHADEPGSPEHTD